MKSKKQQKHDLNSQGRFSDAELESISEQVTAGSDAIGKDNLTRKEIEVIYRAERKCYSTPGLYDGDPS